MHYYRGGMRSKLVAARVAAKLSQAEVAAKLGVTPAAVSAWETGRNAPSAPEGTLFALARLLGVGAEELLVLDPQADALPSTPPPAPETSEPAARVA